MVERIIYRAFAGWYRAFVGIHFLEFRPHFCRKIPECSMIFDEMPRNAPKRFGDNRHWYTKILIHSSIASVARNAGIKSRFLETRAHVATSVKIECYCHDRDNSSHGVCVGWCAASTAATSQVVIGCHGIDDAHRQVRAVSSNLFLFAFLSHTLPPHQPPPPLYSTRLIRRRMFTFQRFPVIYRRSQSQMSPSSSESTGQGRPYLPSSH